MSNKSMVPSGNTGTLVNSPHAATYFNPAGCCSIAFNDTTESHGQVPYALSGTLSELSISNVNTTVTPITFTSRIGGANGNQVVSGTDVFFAQDSTHTDSVAAATLVSTSYVGGTGNAGIICHNYQYNDTTNYGCPYVVYASGSRNVSANSTTFWAPCGLANGTVTEANAQLMMTTSTVRNLFGFFDTNTFNASQTFTIRKNGVSGAGTIVITASTTGLIQDTTHTDSFSQSDLLGIQSVNAASSGSLTSQTLGVWNQGTFGNGLPISGFNTAATTLNIAGTQWGNIAGHQNIALNTPEAQIQSLNPAALTWRHLRVFCSGTSTTDSNCPVVSRKNGSTANQIVTVPPATAGAFLDSTHQDSIAVGDKLTWQETYSGAGGVSFTNIQTEGSDSSQIGSPLPRTLHRPPKKSPRSTKYGYRPTAGWFKRIPPATVPPGPSGGVHQEIVWFGVRAIVVENTNQAGRMLGFTLNSTSADFSLIMAELASKEDAYVANNP